MKGPAGAILPAEQLVAFSAVSNSSTGAVVFDFLADAIGHQSQQHRLNQVATVLEIARGLKVALTCIGPFLLEVANVRNDLVLAAFIVVCKIGVVAKRQYQS